jgi:hypothetical protein
MKKLSFSKIISVLFAVLFYLSVTAPVAIAQVDWGVEFAKMIQAMKESKVDGANCFAFTKMYINYPNEPKCLVKAVYNPACGPIADVLKTIDYPIADIQEIAISYTTHPVVAKTTSITFFNLPKDDWCKNTPSTEPHLYYLPEDWMPFIPNDVQSAITTTGTDMGFKWPQIPGYIITLVAGLVFIILSWLLLTGRLRPAN